MEIFYNQNLSDFTTYKIGGKAKTIFVARTKSELVNIRRFYGGYPLGKGSKILVADSGYDGNVIVNRADGFVFDESGVWVESGVSLPMLVRDSIKRGLSGLEFACQIPASIGGAVVMNAGAFDKSIGDMVEYIEVLRGDEIIKLTADQCAFGYRTSAIKNTGDLVLGARIRLQASADIKRNILSAREGRKNQPHGKSCGSVFKNGNQKSAVLIERAGLKGLCVGGAIISLQHANFIINHSNATASDVYTLIRTAKAKVYAEFGVRLQEEVIYLGEFL